MDRLRFGDFEVDPHARELRKCGIRIRLENQPFEVLLALLERPGELVTRAELQGRIWADGTFVDFEKSLTKAVNKLRSALTDSAATPRYIETLRGVVTGLSAPSTRRQTHPSDQPRPNRPPTARGGCMPEAWPPCSRSQFWSALLSELPAVLPAIK
jgi:DNA-binding winged helix-turn-helix (wHTH) protein